MCRLLERHRRYEPVGVAARSGRSGCWRPCRPAPGSRGCARSSRNVADRRPNERRDPHELTCPDRAVEQALALEKRDVEEGRTVDAEHVDRDEGDGPLRIELALWLRPARSTRCRGTSGTSSGACLAPRRPPGLRRRSLGRFDRQEAVEDQLVGPRSGCDGFRHRRRTRPCSPRRPRRRIGSGRVSIRARTRTPPQLGSTSAIARPCERAARIAGDANPRVFEASKARRAGLCGAGKAWPDSTSPASAYPPGWPRRHAQAEPIISSIVPWRGRQPQLVRGAVGAGHEDRPGRRRRRGPILTAIGWPTTDSAAATIWRLLKPVPLPRLQMRGWHGPVGGPVRGSAGSVAMSASQVRRRQVLDVDVVADARPVRRGVVVAEERQLAPLFGRGQNVRDQMRLRRVLLAVRAARAGHVEVAQDHAPEAVAVAVPGDRPLDAALRLAVGVDRPDRIRLRRSGVRSGIPYVAAVELKTMRSTPAARIAVEQRDAAADVLAEVLGRVGHRLADERLGRAVQDRVDAAPLAAGRSRRRLSP